MHEMAHWVNAVRRNAAYKNRIVRHSSILSPWFLLIVGGKERLLRQLGIVQEGFSLDDPSNLTNRKLDIASPHEVFLNWP